MRKADESEAWWDESSYLKGSSDFSVMTCPAGKYLWQILTDNHGGKVGIE